MRTSRDFEALSEKVSVAFDEIVRKSETPGGVTGVTSGFSKLDKLTSGWQKSDLIILAGRPSMGTPALAIEFA